MRQQNRVPFKTKQTPFWPKKPALKSYNQGDRSNYLSHMAKKRVQHAHRTLDLRRKLIHQRTNREGLDLRWKIVANTIARMRAQLRNNGQTAHRFNPYPPMARSASCSMSKPKRFTLIKSKTLMRFFCRKSSGTSAALQPRCSKPY